MPIKGSYTIDRESFKRSLALLAPAVPTKTTVASLKNVAFDFKDGRVTYQATDLRIGVHAEDVIVQDGDNVAFCLDFQTIQKIVSDCRSETITFNLDWADPTPENPAPKMVVKVVSSSFNAALNALDADDFPTIHTTYADNPTVLPTAWLKAIHQNVVWAAAAPDSPAANRPELCGIYLVIKEHEGLAYGCDSYRIARSQIAFENPAHPAELLIVSEVFPLINKAIENGSWGDTVEIGTTNNGAIVVFRGDNVIVTARTIAMKYPAVDRYVPTHPDHAVAGKPTIKWEWDVADIQAQIKPLEQFAKDSGMICRLALEESGLLGTSVKFTSGTNNGKGESSVDISADFKGSLDVDGEKIALNYGHLAELLKGSPGEKLTFTYWNEKTLILVEAPEKWFACLLPFRNV